MKELSLQAALTQCGKISGISGLWVCLYNRGEAAKYSRTDSATNAIHAVVDRDELSERLKKQSGFAHLRSF